MTTDKIRIKDIARLSGVSIGTVDRVLHNRPNVSKESRAKVEKTLKEINYKPNMYASALAHNKKYNFICLIPRHESETYWEEIEEGAMAACERRSDFHIKVTMMYYRRFHQNTFTDMTKKCLEEKPDGVIIVPSEHDITKAFTDKLHEKNIPFILLDSYIPDLNPLSFYGQDSFRSGYFAGRMLMLIAGKDKEVTIMKQMKNGNVASKQQEDREKGFLNYMSNFFPNIRISEVDMPLDTDPSEYENILDSFFSTHKDVSNCITFNSHAYILGEYFQKKNINNVKIMGYDMVRKNAECVKNGTISFLIAQHAYMQGYSCIETLFESIVLKMKVNTVNYMPIEFLTQENIQFYRRAQL